MELVCDNFSDVLDKLEEMILNINREFFGASISCRFELFVLIGDLIKGDDGCDVRKFKIDELLLSYPVYNDKVLLEFVIGNNSNKTFSKLFDPEEIKEIKKCNYIVPEENDNITIFFRKQDLIENINYLRNLNVVFYVEEIEKTMKQFNSLYLDIALWD